MPMFSKLSKLQKILLAFIVVVLLLAVLEGIFNSVSNVKTENNLMQAIGEETDVYGIRVEEIGRDFVMGFPNTYSKTKISAIADSYNRYVSADIINFEKRFDSITLRFYSDDVSEEPIVVIRCENRNLLIEEIDFSNPELID